MRRAISGTIHSLGYLNKSLDSNQTGDVRMNRNLIVLILLTVFVAPLMADKPEWAGNGKPTDEQKAAHKSVMEAKGDSDDDDDYLLNEKKQKKEKKEKKEKKDKSSKLKGIEKQGAKKSEQEQKEVEKGSDKGQASREENRKKWWKLWGE